ncbi:MAG: hypothetical protein ACKODT_07295 [Fluviibacter sp.]
MPGLSVYFVNKIIDHNLRGQTYSVPASVYVQLHTADPGSLGSSGISAVSTRKAATLSAASGGGTVLVNDITWNMTNRETITHISLWDASTGGNCLLTAPLEEAKNVYNGDTFQLPMLSVSIPAEA